MSVKQDYKGEIRTGIHKVFTCVLREFLIFNSPSFYKQAICDEQVNNIKQAYNFKYNVYTAEDVFNLIKYNVLNL